MALKLINPKLRFDGWEPSGVFKRPKDVRTASELRASVEAWSRTVPEVKQILPELKNLKKSHLGLVADTIELSQKKATRWKDVDLRNVSKDGIFAPLDYLMYLYPKLAKTNTSALDFTKEVIDNAGQITSKFYLRDAVDLQFLTMKNTEKNFKAGVPVVESMAKYALNAPANGRAEFAKQEEFVELVLSILDENANAKKIPFLKDILNRVSNGGFGVFDIDKFLSDKTPVKLIKANLPSLDNALNHCYSFGKRLDVNEQLSKKLGDDSIAELSYYI